VQWVLFALAVLLVQVVVASHWSDACCGAVLVVTGAIAITQQRLTWQRFRTLLLAILAIAAAGALVHAPDWSRRAWDVAWFAGEAPMRVESLLEGQVTTGAGYNIRGSIIDVSPSSTGGVRLAVAVDDLALDREEPRAASGVVALSIRYGNQRWHTGDRIKFRSRLRRLTSYGNFGEFDWAAYNARRGIFASAYAWRESDVERLEGPRSSVDRMRLALSLACDRTGGQGAAMLEALTSGDRFRLSTATSLAMRDAGLSHFLAISGSHMVLVAALAVGLLRWTLGLSQTLIASYDVMRPAALAGAAAVVAYAVITGGGVSVARSVLMALASLLALWRGRPGDELRALGGSAVMLALVLPGVGEEAGFQLSFAAVAVLIAYGRWHRERKARDRAAAGPAAQQQPAGKRAAGAQATPPQPTPQPQSTAPQPMPQQPTPQQPTPQQPAQQPTPQQQPTATRLPAAPTGLCNGYTLHLDRHAAWRRGLDLVLEATKITLVCCAVTSPIVAQHFHRISLVAPLANLFAAPLVSAIVVIGLGALVAVPLWPYAGRLLVELGARLSDALVFVANTAASLPFASIAVPAPGPVLTVALAAFPFALLALSGARRAAALAGLVVVVAVCAAHGLHERFRDDRLDAWFASVGQGDAAVLRMPGGKVMVIDAGSEGKGRMVLEPLLRRLWIGRIDVLAASHMQADHAGAFPELLDAFDVGEMWIPAGACEGPAASVVLDEARERGIPVRHVRAGGGDGRAMRDTALAPQTAGDCTTMRDATLAPQAVDDGTTMRDATLAPQAVDDGAQQLIHAPRFTSDAGTVLSTAAATLEVLNPADDVEACDSNDQSLMLAVGFAGKRLLFTGDIEARGEQALVAAHAPLAADLLKVPHHGSATSSTSAFLDAVSPKLAIVSLGLDNHYGFPDRNVEQRYLAHGTRLLRTDHVGAVHVSVSASGIAVGTAIEE